ncbi:TAT-variant-translocated molybdopterin oxidoreductase [Parachryseolinea silvisoli]|uniref:TAT-variant-translocated molybdopterin oxidoreductase n=1 Tax=Parachryseolinea silvisoli TaxID=2873601 RepID=UPI0022659698|nr:TAT-variant-translocated molybdopterin oxidoreductase [Parachryseolinea silvisoli]MCD9017448.1 TAT-variant-translocated molybdopterin oxidoreductase [Parachryseolinea silvisoli]
MEESKKIYWKGIEQLANHPAFVKHAHNEFAPGPEPEEDPGHSRRDFLKMMGFGMSAVALAACEAPIRKAIPYINKPTDLDPSVPNYYASTYINGGDYASIVVKTREGRPIKIDGNALSSVTRGGTSAQVEASVLSLYDNARLRGPKIGKDKISWEDLDKQVIAKLKSIAAQGGQIRVVSNTILSPSTKAAIEKFKAAYPTTQVVQYDQTSAFGIVKANEESFGAAIIPSYDFSKAKTIVGVAADFIGSWISPIEFTKQYAQTREVTEDKREMSRHYQFESIMSITGANADYRVQIKPSEEGAVVIQLYNLIAAKAGRPAITGGVDKPNLGKAAEELWKNKGAALVVAGSNDKAIQVIVNAINDMLGSYGTTINTALPVNYRQGDDLAMANFVNELEGGKIDVVIFYNCNPVYDHPSGEKIANAIKALALSVATAYKEEETGTLANYLAPDHHFLEAWNDAEPKPGHYSLGQPAITPIFKSRAAQESFLVWAGETDVDYFEVLKNNWKNWFYTGQTLDYQSFWDKCLYDGVFEKPATLMATAPAFGGNVSAAASAIASNYKTSQWELVIYESGNIGNGSQANNPLLQELPDPITKTTWDHYVTVSPKDASGIDFSESITKYYTITANGKTVKLPLLVQPGQTPGTIGIPLGYGRTKAGKVADGIGANVYPIVTLVNGSLSYNAADVKFEATTETYQIAQTQTHNTYMGRETVVQETILEEFKDKHWEREFQPSVATWTQEDHKAKPDELSMWKGHEYKDHHWAMSIDLNTCTGCAACVVACNVENNVSLVGREEVINRREMHWLRIDRYYSSDAPADDWAGVEVAAENPEVVFQPMLCQHCNNAPCETVCPVAATTHSTEGLNQMTYNRCIGTRYCANNCPYKVRRFNWFKYHDNKQFEVANPAMNTDLGKMVLNPDVTVRSRGVMEKCSFCVQRIQGGKLTAKKEKRSMQDGDVDTACAAACSTGAIVFGDINNPESRISKLLKIKKDPKRPNSIDKVAENPRAYRVIEEIGVKPNIWYLTKVRNKDSAKA